MIINEINEKIKNINPKQKDRCIDDVENSKYNQREQMTLITNNQDIKQ